MTIKLSNPTLIHLQKLTSSYAEEFKQWYDIQRQIFQTMAETQLELEISRAIHQPIFLQKSAEQNLFLNNFTVLFAILNNNFASSQLVRPLTVLTLDDEQLDAGMIFFETIELIARQKKLLNFDDELERLRRQIASLLTKEQWQSIVGRPKLTQNKFYPLLGMSIATAYNGKGKSDAKY
ncbi:hypothetical protein GCM10010099_23160 [Streptomyces cinereus]|nr:hypothetical protein GCM10010099_23160 [Streptomyces cinereus]